MTSAQFTNILITIVIALIGYLGKRMIDKLDKFEKTVQDILISDMADKKDIEMLKSDVEDHEIRISKLEAE
jgi:hypothetical protein